jgi:TetR/AcrR family transcriptional regulator, regulator of autoinduction and epiphytic fitness
VNATSQERILDAAVQVFGRVGFKKASMEQLAAAAGLSKQGLYLHFAGKDELVKASMVRYLEEGLRLVEEALAEKAPLRDRLVSALDAWFGRHFVNFNPATLEAVEPRKSPPWVEDRKASMRAMMARAIKDSPECRKNVCTPVELSKVLFQFGLTWKEGHISREAFLDTVRLCVRACCQLPRRSR